MIIIKPYDPQWATDFESIRAALSELLGTRVVKIDHIGSTSVPGLGAKDVIDIQVTVQELSPKITQKLVNAGYEHWANITRDHVPAGEAENPKLWEKLFFSQPQGERRANIHVRVAGNPNQRYPLLFRDYLRAHPHSAQSVEIIKQAIARYHADDIEAYYDIKDPVYDLIWDAAQEWASFTNWQGK